MAAKRPAPKKLSPKPRPSDVAVPVDPSLKAAWDAIAQRIDAASGAGAKAFDVVWEAAGQAVEHDPPLYVFGGYKTPAEFYREHLHTEPRTAARNIRVAKYASPADEQRYGATNLDAALAYLEAKHGPLNGRLPVAFDKLKIPQGDSLVPFAKLTAVEIQQATRALAPKGKKKTPAQVARDAYAAALAEVESLAGVRVTEQAGKVSFGQVPLAAMGRFARVVASVKVPPRH